MKSIRSYLLSRLLGGAVLVIAGAGFAVYVIVARSLEAQFDRNLADRIQGFASLLFQVEDEVEFEFSDQLMPEYEREEFPAYFELWFQDGRLLERSNSLQGLDLAVVGTPTYEPTHWTATLPDGRAGRFAAQLREVHHVYPEEGPGRPSAATVLVAVAMGREELNAAERVVLINCIVVAFALIALIAVLSWAAVTRGLAPANRLAAALDRLQIDHLPESLTIGGLPSELGPMAQKTDALIRRVDMALERERRTTADIAHELRTPISELLTVSEVALRNGRDADEVRKALGTVRDVAGHMGRSVSTLLKFARLEMGAETCDHVGVDIGEIVGELLRSLSAVERERGLHVENRVAVGERIEGDRDVLRIVVSNLLGNALYHSPPRGVVRCSLERMKDGWQFRVENDAVDLQPEDLRALSEPYWRKHGAGVDGSRSGLGLALSRALAQKTGMELSFVLEQRTFRAMLSRAAETAPGNGRDASNSGNHAGNGR